MRLIDRSKILVQLHFKDFSLNMTCFELNQPLMDNFVTKPKLTPYLPSAYLNIDILYLVSMFVYVFITCLLSTCIQKK